MHSGNQVPTPTYVIILAAILLLYGCLNPVKPAPNLEEANIGTITGALAEEIKSIWAYSDESNSFRHWQHRFQYCKSCYSRALLDQAFFGAYREPCASKRGTILYVPSRTDPRAVECRSAAGDLIFAVYARIDTKSVNPLGSAASLWYITADSFEPKAPGQSPTVQNEYSEEGGTYVRRNTEQERAAAQARAEQARNHRDRQIREQAEYERRKQIEIARNLPIVKTIGQKICTSVMGNERHIVAYALGKPVYSNPEEQQFLVTGFTEQVSGSRIRILIGGIQKRTANGFLAIDKLGGDVVWENGKSIWDNASQWMPCQ